MFERFRWLTPDDPDVVVTLPQPFREEVEQLLESGERIEAVKLTRRRTGMNLLPAVRAVDALTPLPPPST